MATVTVRDLPEATRRALKGLAASHNRSMEAEVRDILERAVGSRPDFVSDWISATASLRGEFEVPDRAPARSVSLS